MGGLIGSIVYFIMGVIGMFLIGVLKDFLVVVGLSVKVIFVKLIYGVCFGVVIVMVDGLSFLLCEEDVWFVDVICLG